MQVTAFDASSTTGTPSVDLPVGTVFWRAYGRNGGGTSSIASPTWEFTVGARTAASNTSWGTTPDFNGDGFTDVIVGEVFFNTDTGRVFVFMGGPAGVASTPSLVLMAPEGAPVSEFGGVVASAGDVNGDGYADALITAPRVGNNTGRAYIYYGGASGLGVSPSITLIGPDGSGGFFGDGAQGASAASAGDVNGDGYADVIIGARFANGSAGRAYLYLGGASGLASTPARVFDGPAGAAGEFGWGVRGAGDVNGDGFGDFVITARPAMANAGQAYVFLGGAGGISTTPTLTLTGAPAAGLGDVVAGAGDVNGDGFADIIITAPGQAAAYVYFGAGPTGSISPAPSVTFANPGAGIAGSNFPKWVAGAGDLNGDGFADILVGDSLISNNGRAYIFTGGPSGPAAVPTVTLEPPDLGGSFGSRGGGLGDINGDGRSDVAVSAGGANAGLGRVHVYLGNATSILPGTPSFSLADSDGAGSDFGNFVAMLNPIPRRGLTANH
jgi:hypothetical protein